MAMKGNQDERQAKANALWRIDEAGGAIDAAAIPAAAAESLIADGAIKAIRGGRTLALTRIGAMLASAIN